MPSCACSTCTYRREATSRAIDTRMGSSVYFTDWNAKVTVDGRQPQVNQRKAGTFAWSDAVIHTVENVSKSEGHVLRIELKY